MDVTLAKNHYSPCLFVYKPVAYCGTQQGIQAWHVVKSDYKD